MTEYKVFSACPHDCPDTCAMITTVRDGKAIAVRGNPDHPFTRGGLCVKVNDCARFWWFVCASGKLCAVANGVRRSCLNAGCGAPPPITKRRPP
jgi:Molybdopterin oxidoreductase Fe4S4 domain